MSDPGGSETVLTVALSRLEHIDPAAALDARHALDWVLGEGSLETLSRFALQQYCWYELPFKWIVAPDVRVEIVHALARFFDLAGLPRYAELCRSGTTRRVLDAWASDAGEGFKAFRSAMTDSGLEPPHLPELTWNSAMEPEEANAFWSTALMLELAVDTGELVPGARGWRARQVELARRHLLQPRDERLGESLLQAVLTERLVAWIQGGWGVGPTSDARTQMLAPVGNALLSAPNPPRGAARALAPLRWFLRTVAEPGERDGVVLTQGGNLPQWLVAAAVVEHPNWGPGGGRPLPKREQQCPELHLLHQLARELKMIRSRGGRLTLTAAGRAGLEHTPSLWRTVASGLVRRDDFEAAVVELLLAALLVEPLLDAAEFRSEALVVLTECGWHEGGSGAPVPVEALAASFSATVATLRVLGMVRLKERDGVIRLVRLTEVGRSTALAALRARATAPRRV